MPPHRHPETLIRLKYRGGLSMKYGRSPDSLTPLSPAVRGSEVLSITILLPIYRGHSSAGHGWTQQLHLHYFYTPLFS